MNIVMLWYQHDWGLYGRRYEMIARTWVKEHPDDHLLVVEPPLNPWIWFREFRSSVFSRDWVLTYYWLSRLRSLFFPLDREDNHLWVLRPFLWWPYKSVGASRWTLFSFSVAWRQVKHFLNKNQWIDPLLWGYPPHAFVYYAASQWKDGRVCIDLVDDNTQYQSLGNAQRKHYETAYAAMVERADVIFSVSPALADKNSSSTKKVIHIPNAAAIWPLPFKPSKLPALPTGPRLCYVGRIDERLDFALLQQVIRRLPDAQFIFVGSFASKVKALWQRDFKPLKNVHAIGTVLSANIPAVLNEMDICLLPHRITALTDSMDPLKLYTYLSARKPILATGVYIDPSLKPWVHIFDSADSFEEAFKKLEPRLAPHSAPDLSSHSWPHRVAAMETHLR